MAIIKKMKIFNGSSWVQHDFGVEATNVAVQTIDGLDPAATNLQQTLFALNDAINNVGGTFPIHLDSSTVVTGTLGVTNGGTGLTSINNIKTDLASTVAANALSNNIGVTGVLSVANGGTGVTVAPDLYANLGSSVSANPFSSSTVGVRGTLPVGNGGTGLTSISNIKVNLASTEAANALSNNIGVTGILPVANGGTGKNTAPSIRTNLASSGAGNPLTGNIGVTGVLPVANGGTGKNSAPTLYANLGSTAANNVFTGGSIGVQGTLPVARGGTGKTYGYAWQNLMGATNTSKKWTLLKNNLSLSGYSEILIVARYGTSYLSSCLLPVGVIPSGKLPATTDNADNIATGYQIYLGGGASSITSGTGGTRRAVCRMTTTTFGAYQGSIDGQYKHFTWYLYAR